MSPHTLLRPLLILSLLLSLAAAVPVAAAPLASSIPKQTQLAYLKAAQPGLQDSFGERVAISGNTMAVGSFYEDGPAPPGGTSLSDSGAVYVFARAGDGWRQQVYLKAPNADPDDYFGAAVAISGDILVVGADGEDGGARQVNGDPGDNSLMGAGAAYVYHRRDGAWTFEAYLKPHNADSLDRYGYSVAVSGDTIVVGAIYEAGGIGGVNTDGQDNSLYGAGAAYVFVRSLDPDTGRPVWSQQAYLKPDQADRYSNFGSAVAVSGDTVLVSAPAQGGDVWNDGGVGYVFVRSGSNWTQQAMLVARNAEAGDSFGTAVALDGDTAVLGANCEDSLGAGVNPDGSDNSGNWAGAAYVFARSGDVWRQQAYLKAANPESLDRFGEAVSISGDRIVVGAPFESSGAQGAWLAGADNSVEWSGAAYVFYRFDDTWSLEMILKASNAGYMDTLGKAVGISGDRVVLGAPLDDSGFPGLPEDNSLGDAGAVYTYRLWSQRYFVPLVVKQP